MAGVHQVATGEGALTLRFNLPPDFKINPLIDSQVIATWGEPVQPDGGDGHGRQRHNPAAIQRRQHLRDGRGDAVLLP